MDINKPIHTTEDISVVIPFYNRSNFIKRLLWSIKTQTLKPKHVYIVDNGSSIEEISKCLDIIKISNFDEIVVTLVSTLLRGNANYARNLGMHLSTTKYVAFLDSDDWWEKNHLELSIHNLEKSGKAAIYGGAIIHEKNTRINNSFDVAEFSNPFDFLFSKRKAIAQTSSYVANIEKIKNVSWDESLRRHQDYDFFASVFYNTAGWAFLVHATTNIDWLDGGSRNIDYKSMIRFLLKWGSKFDNKTLQEYLFIQNLTCHERDSPIIYRNYYRKKFISSSKFKMTSYIRTSKPFLIARTIAASIAKKYRLVSL